MFPLQFAELLDGIAGQLKDRVGSRLPVVRRNPSPSEVKEGLVAEFRPSRELVLLSLSADMPNDEGAQLWQWVLQFCPRLDARRTSSNSGHGPVYAFLGSSPPLVVVERWYHYQTRKYRATDKFTGGLNRKLVRLEEKRVH
jgi:hypothetical protein